MERLYPLDTDKKILLASSGSGLYSYLFRNERLLRSSLLCSNYELGLSATLYNGSLYYSYINKEQSLLIRSLGESALQFRLDCTETVTFRSPELVEFGGALLLIYFECTNGTYHLRILTPFAILPSLAVPSTLSVSFAELPSLCILPTAQHLYLILSSGTTSALIRYTTSFVPEVLGSEKEMLTRFRIPWEAELQAMNTLLSEKEAKLHAQEALLSEKAAALSDTTSLLEQSEKKLHYVRNQLTECEASRRETLQNLAYTSGLLERAKVQYEELMQIALQYKEEAAKWYRKFTDRH